MTMWVRASGANAAAHLIDLWNSTPRRQGHQARHGRPGRREVPDLVSFDLIYMPDFMKADFLTDLTADLKANPNFASVAKA